MLKGRQRIALKLALIRGSNVNPFASDLTKSSVGANVFQILFSIMNLAQNFLSESSNWRSCANKKMNIKKFTHFMVCSRNRQKHARF